MISLELQDKNGEALSEMDMGTVLNGKESKQQLRIVNTGDEDVIVQLYPSIGEYQRGLSFETYEGTWLSLNDFNYSTRIFCNVPVDGFVEFYVKWRPVHVNQVGYKRWGLSWVVVEGNVEVLCSGN